MEIVIPRKYIQRDGIRSKRCLHYTLVKVYPNCVMYKCEENGTYECFNKSNFIKLKKGEEPLKKYNKGE